MDTSPVPCAEEMRWRNIYLSEPDGQVLIDAWSADSHTSAVVSLLLSKQWQDKPQLTEVNRSLSVDFSGIWIRV